MSTYTVWRGRDDLQSVMMKWWAGACYIYYHSAHIHINTYSETCTNISGWKFGCLLGCKNILNWGHYKTVKHSWPTSILPRVSNPVLTSPQWQWNSNGCMCDSTTSSKKIIYTLPNITYTKTYQKHIEPAHVNHPTYVQTHITTKPQNHKTVRKPT